MLLFNAGHPDNASSPREERPGAVPASAPGPFWAPHVPLRLQAGCGAVAWAARGMGLMAACLLLATWPTRAAAIPPIDPNRPIQKLDPGPPKISTPQPPSAANSTVAETATASGLVLPTLRVPFTQKAPLLDANPQDSAWNAAATIEALLPSIVPGGQSPPVAATRVRVLWDADFLYVRCEAVDDDVVTPFTERDANHYMGDVAEIFLDPVGDGRHYYELQLSPRGGVLDQYIVLSAEPRTDAYGCLLPEVRARDFWVNSGWNCEGLKTAARLLGPPEKPTGWIVEMALPARSVLTRLGQTQFAPSTLRANFLRYDWPLDRATGKRNLVPGNWSPVLSGSPHKSAARMGFLQLEAPLASQGSVLPGAASP